MTLPGLSGHSIPCVGVRLRTSRSDAPRCAQSLCGWWDRPHADGVASSTVEYGEHTYYYIDIPEGLAGSKVLVELQQEERSAMAFPMLFVRKGDIPHPIKFRYSGTVSSERTVWNATEAA